MKKRNALKRLWYLNLRFKFEKIPRPIKERRKAREHKRKMAEWRVLHELYKELTEIRLLKAGLMAIERETYRQNKEWDKADAMRINILQTFDVAVGDNKDGSITLRDVRKRNFIRQNELDWLTEEKASDIIQP